MKLFDISFPNPNICDVADLYYRSAALCTGYCLILRDAEKASFDTFFNLFSCGKYLKHTVVSQVRLVLDVEGDVEVEIFHTDGEVKTTYCWAEGVRVKRGTELLVPQEMPQGMLIEKSIASFRDRKTLRRKIEIPFSLEPSGYIYFAVTAHGGAKIYGGYYEAMDCPALPVKIGLVICTYKRESYVRKNVANIRKYLEENPDLQDKLQIFVIDNGHTLTAADVPEATLIANKNLGGSGGFTRGMMEVCGREGFTHILLSDDDVVYQPSMFRKTISLLQAAKNPTELAVGAVMLHYNEPKVQHEFGALWVKQRVTQKTLHRGFDVTKQAALLKNEQAPQPDYAAWWYLCMPTEKIKTHGYALPLFIKCDDIEHGVRTQCEIALLNGIGLWHESFENKYSPYLDYYVVRNNLITDCLTKRSGGRKMFKWILAHVSLQLVYQRYFVLPYIFSACKDFFKGAKFLLNTDGEALNKKLIAANIKMQTKEQLEKEGYNLEEIYYPKRGKTFMQVVSLNGQLIPSCFYKKQNRKYRVVTMQKCYPRQFYKVKRVVHYNPVTQTGFVTKQRFGQLFVAGFKLVGLAFKMLFCYRKAAKSYRKNYQKLTSEETWKQLLELECDTTDNNKGD